MKEAHRLYYLAQARQTELKDLALDFYRECIKNFEEEAKEGRFCFVLDNNDIPDSIHQEDFEKLVIPLFKDEGFEVEFEQDLWSYGTSHGRWIITWKKGE